MREQTRAGERTEGRTGRVSPPQGRGESEDAGRPGKVGFVPPGAGPPFAGERMFVRVTDAEFEDIDYELHVEAAED